MKNRKKLFIFAIVVAIVLFIALFFIYYYHESSLLDSNDKKWINENGKKKIDVEVFNDVSVFGVDGNGVIFDILNYIEDETSLQFNKIPYSKENGTTGNTYKFELVDGAVALDSNKLSLYEDNYIAIGKKEIEVNNISDFNGYTIGVLKLDESNISYYLKSVDNIKYNSYETYTELFQALDDGEINFGIVSYIETLNKTINNSEYYLNYFFTDINKKIVLTLDNNNSGLNSIITKYFNNFLENYYVSDYNKLLLNYYIDKNDINDKTKTDLLSKTYVYGYVENVPYEITNGSRVNGIALEYINRIERLTDIDFTYKKYNTIDDLNKAINTGNVDIYFDYIENQNSKYLKTVSPFIESFVVLGRISDEYVITSLESLKGKTVSLLSNNKYLTSYIKNSTMANVKNFNNVKDLVKNSKNDKNIIILDKEVYTYYKNKELKDYEILYTNIMTNNYSFMVKSDNDSFFKLFNYIINTNSYYNYRNMGFNNLNTSILKTTSFEETYLLILAIILIPIILGVLVFAYIKNRHKLRLVKKEDRKKYTDMLTSLKNRNYLNLQIDTWNMSRVYPQTIVVVDLNNLKYINDNYGREKGDNLIVRAASMLVNTQLENSEIIRTDGTEFIIYLVGYTENQIEIYTNKLRKELAELPYGYGASVGSSMIFDNIKTIDDAINEAMIDMQSDKESYR
ncbi:MAG: GGDEF domain-containing protein [Bacilli bacterium]|nr:GGDEF domain-containing protein [Bacilli bacterium]